MSKTQSLRLARSLPSEAMEVFRQLRDVLVSEPALAQRLRETHTPEEAAEMLARIGAVHGIPTNATELQGHVYRLIKSAGTSPLSDEALEGVAGGAGAVQPAWRSVFSELLSLPKAL
jgi:hypothetical protein